MAQRLWRSVEFDTRVGTVIGFMIAAIVGFLTGTADFLTGDAEGYWSLSLNGLGFRPPDRDPNFGYVMPLVDLVTREVSRLFAVPAGAMVVLFNSALFALLGTVLLPALWRGVSGVTLSVSRRLALLTPLLFFWHGYESYLLTDVLGLAALAACLVCAARGAPVASIAAGATLAAACNLRPNVIVAVPIVILLIVRSRDHRTIRLSLLFAGFVLVSVPQAVANRSPSPLVGSGGYLQEIGTGLALQRFESSINSTGVAVPIYYFDPKMSGVVANLPGQNIASYSSYIDVVRANVLGSTMLFVRHVVNGLDVHYATPYTSRIDRQINVLDVFSLAAVCAAIALLLARQVRVLNWLPIAGLALPAVVSIPTAMEPRFFLGADVVMYLVVVSAPFSWMPFRRRWFMVMPSIALIAWLWAVVIPSALSEAVVG